MRKPEDKRWDGTPGPVEEAETATGGQANHATPHAATPAARPPAHITGGHLAAEQPSPMMGERECMRADCSATVPIGVQFCDSHKLHNSPKVESPKPAPPPRVKPSTVCATLDACADAVKDLQRQQPEGSEGIEALACIGRAMHLVRNGYAKLD